MFITDVFIIFGLILIALLFIACINSMIKYLQLMYVVFRSDLNLFSKVFIGFNFNKIKEFYFDKEEFKKNKNDFFSAIKFFIKIFALNVIFILIIITIVLIFR